MQKIIKTINAPAPVGPYNQAILAGNTLYLSGQIALDPSTGNLMMDNIEAETTQVMENLKAVLEEAGFSFGNVVKTTIFLSDMEMFGRMNAIYAQYFEGLIAPARETVQVANLPKYVNVEISCIAVK
ncbi:MAG: RidA family protein [Saprospiraceae bacterium]|nr:RidA family protein [Saprospiraceae bacterium]MBK8634370.1 RidA family protein [Saprospiraceae bacterium]MBP7642850.1 RidA family protein [Saprospiraceae bacterium]HMS66572.1 RidA family protein [Saprospiraceae bacterium]